MVSRKIVAPIQSGRILALIDALEVVEGKIQKPEQPNFSANEATQKKYQDDLKEYLKANNCTMMVLRNSMTEETLQNVMGFDSATDACIPESYENFRIAIESRDELPSRETLKIKLIEDANARKIKKFRPSMIHNELFTPRKSSMNVTGKQKVANPTPTEEETEKTINNSS
ncbi:hypothetical protein AVEN_262634-1 [Araneus ventricosus]|uniref:Uncharacterized protein n=1 Tax=Araneus ventricosus TaxID=182803 RepID=A0A4Y2P0S9_ARAVE|nr:hypothetical protein AVEN_262634-1 [Araneus ventricosus]